MIALNPNYVVDARQRRKSVLFSVVEWNRIIRELRSLTTSAPMMPRNILLGKRFLLNRPSPKPRQETDAPYAIAILRTTQTQFTKIENDSYALCG